MDKVEAYVDEVLEAALSLLEDGADGFAHPVIAGWSIQLDAAGRHRIVPFGNVRHGLSGLEAGWREPHVRWWVDEENREVRLEAEVPGARRDGVQVEVQPDLVRIRAEGEDRRYEVEVAPGVVLGGKCRARYEDGVLRVRVRLARRSRGKPRAVRVKG